MSSQIENKELNNDEIEIDLLEVFYYLKARIVWLAIAFVAGAVLFGGYTYFFITPKYQATSKVYMVSASSDSVINLSDLNLGTSLSADYVELLKIRPIFEDVIKELDLSYSYKELLGMTEIANKTGTRMLTITTTSTDPEEAKDVANALAEKAVTYVPEVMETSAPNIAEYAIVPTKKSSPSLSKNTLIGALVGIILLGAIFVIQLLMDDTFKSSEDVEKMLGVMPLTIIPEGELDTLNDKSEKEHIKQRRRRQKKEKAAKGETQDGD